MIGLPPTERAAPGETRLAPLPAVIFPFVLVGANLAGQVNSERLRDRNHLALRRNRMGTANHTNRLEEKSGLPLMMS